MRFIPETLFKIVISNAIKRHISKNRDKIAITAQKINVFREIRFVTTITFRIMAIEPIVTFLAIYNGWVYKFIFLYLNGIFNVFVFNNDFS
jgi:hypothetical protein